jgi:predicted acyltransferase
MADSPQRLLSLDALRGFDMCCILGMGSALQLCLQRVLPGSAVTGLVETQLEHVAWAGMHFEDLIFPLFLFLSGLSMALSVPRRQQREGAAAVVRHLLARAGFIFFLGVIFSGGLSKGLDEVRWLGVLQRIGIASAAAGLLSVFFGWRGLVGFTLALLVGYCLLLSLIQVPGYGAGDFAEGHNLTNYFDKLYLPGRKYDGDHDPEGVLSTLPAVATALLGLLAGKWMQHGKAKLLGLIAAGLVLVALGWAWHPVFPVVKKLWSSSFVLVAGGYSLMLLAAFHWLVDIKGWKSWCRPFVWVGANPLFLYLISGMGAFRAITPRLVGPLGAGWLSAWVSFALMLLVARWLYKKGIFIRV